MRTSIILALGGQEKSKETKQENGNRLSLD